MPLVGSLISKTASRLPSLRALAMARVWGLSLPRPPWTRSWSRARKTTSSEKRNPRAITLDRDVGVGGKLLGVHMNGSESSSSSSPAEDVTEFPTCICCISPLFCLLGGAVGRSSSTVIPSNDARGLFRRPLLLLGALTVAVKGRREM